MPYRIRTVEEKRRLVEAWRRSGVPRTRFARDNDLPPRAFARWCEDYGSSPHGLSTDLVRVEVVPEGPAAPLVLHVAGKGHRIEVPRGFDPDVPSRRFLPLHVPGALPLAAGGAGREAGTKTPTR